MLARPGMAVCDAWIAMAAVATATREITFGAMVTPLARRRPWVLARQAAALDRMSGGRLVIGVGLGDDGWKEFSSFGEATEPRERRLLLDESLEVLQRLLAGEDVAFDGQRLTVHATPFLPRPVQDPVPIWVGARWPNRAPSWRGWPANRLVAHRGRDPARRGFSPHAVAKPFAGHGVDLNLGPRRADAPERSRHDGLAGLRIGLLIIRNKTSGADDIAGLHAVFAPQHLCGRQIAAGRQT